MPLPIEFYDRDPVTVARELLGTKLVRERGGRVTSGIIVETEAYLARGDAACHAFRGQTRRNAAMFGPPGRAYVYAIHAHHCLNVVTEAAGVPSAVLVRAIAPLEGLALMKRRRRTRDPTRIGAGPGNLCQALLITRAHNEWDLTAGQTLWVSAPDGAQRFAIACGPRIGVTAAHDLPLRFVVKGSPHLSKPLLAAGRGRRVKKR